MQYIILAKLFTQKWQSRKQFSNSIPFYSARLSLCYICIYFTSLYIYFFITSNPFNMIFRHEDAMNFLGSPSSWYGLLGKERYANFGYGMAVDRYLQEAPVVRNRNINLFKLMGLLKQQQLQQQFIYVYIYLGLFRDKAIISCSDTTYRTNPSINNLCTTLHIVHRIGCYGIHTCFEITDSVRNLCM